MKRLFSKFKKSEDGAVTVDWVVLTAAMTGFGVLITTIIIDGATDQSSGLGARLSSVSIEK